MSARAAVRLETLGFTRVFRYKPGKAAWLADGLPIEGMLARIPRAGDVARRDVPTCQRDERVGVVAKRLQETGWEQCIVVNERRVVLGRVRMRHLAANPALVVEDVMENGPTTIRPSVLLADIARRMHERQVGTIIVTNSDGQLVGILFRQDADERLARTSR